MSSQVLDQIKLKSRPGKYSCITKADKQHLRQNITNKNLCERYTKNLTTDEIWINFKEKVLKAIDETVPTKLINNTKKKLPWITREIKTLICKRNKLFKRMKLHNSTKLVEAYKNIKPAIQKETRKAYWTYMENIICYDENLDVTQKQKKILELH